MHNSIPASNKRNGPHSTKIRTQQIITKESGATKIEYWKAKFEEVSQELQELKYDMPLIPALLEIIEGRLPESDYGVGKYIRKSIIKLEESLPKYLRHHYDHYLGLISEKGFPFNKYQWLRNDLLIRKRGKQTRLFDALDYLWQVKNWQTSVNLEEKLGLEPAKVRKTKKSEMVHHWILQVIDYRDMSEELSGKKPIAENSCRRIIEAMVREELIFDVGFTENPQQGGKKVYVVGIWHLFWNAEVKDWDLNPLPLFKRKTHEERLRRFRINVDTNKQ